MENNRKILLHTCCAPCATHCVEALQSGGLTPVLFFSNSNINTKEEYDKRLGNVKRLSKNWKIELIEDEYDHSMWLEKARGLENEPEKGQRCTKCFSFSFGKASEKARELGIMFTTTLSVSPHKKSEMILAAGSEFDNFQFFDFKKENGYRRSIALTKQLGLYRQNYCGCEFRPQKNRKQ